MSNIKKAKYEWDPKNLKGTKLRKIWRSHNGKAKKHYFNTIDRNTTYIFLVLYMEYNCFTDLIYHQFQLRC